MSVKQDLPSTLISERAQYDYLSSLLPRTSTGDVSFTSNTSGQIYSTVSYNSGAYAGQGQEGMLKVLTDVLKDYLVNAADFNSKANKSDVSVFLPGASNSTQTNMTYNNTPVNGALGKFIYGDDTNPVTTGNAHQAVSIERVDASPRIGNGDRQHIHALTCVNKRKAAARGYAFAGYFYLEDGSDDPTPTQSVACTGSAHSTSHAQVWGLYAEGWQHTTTQSVGTGAEIDCFNYSGVDNAFDDIPVMGAAHSKSLWMGSVGLNKALLALGIIASPANCFRRGLYIGPNAVDKIGFDMQCTPETLIRFRNGAKTNGAVGGIGLDTGSLAQYGTGTNQGAIHLWDNDVCFGDTGLGKIRYNPATSSLEFWYNGVKRGHLDCTGVDHAI